MGQALHPNGRSSPRKEFPTGQNLYDEHAFWVHTASHFFPVSSGACLRISTCLISSSSIQRKSYLPGGLLWECNQIIYVRPQQGGSRSIVCPRERMAVAASTSSIITDGATTLVGLSQILLQATQRLFNTREGKFSCWCIHACVCVYLHVCAYLRSQKPWKLKQHGLRCEGHVFTSSLKWLKVYKKRAGRRNTTPPFLLAPRNWAKGLANPRAKVTAS